jgi:hypothetical protein
LPSAKDRDRLDQGPTEDKGSAVFLHQFEKMTYVQAILWIGARLADGLAHAHDQGILHRDLKPANILLTDQGQPMLLDFNLSEDTKRRGADAAALVGGTLPYMAPEHLRAFQGGASLIDARSDVYSLGVILYELLTGRHPFPGPSDSAGNIIPRLLEERLQAPPKFGRRQKAISPAVESIVRHCLEPDPARRYQSACELHEDLERQRHHLPLRYAREPSLRERAGKWKRRHPRLTSASTVGIIAAVLLLGLGIGFMTRLRHLARLEAVASLQEFRQDLRASQFLLNAYVEDHDQLAAGMVRCRQTLDRYHVLDDPSWQKLSPVRRSPVRTNDPSARMWANCCCCWRGWRRCRR